METMRHLGEGGGSVRSLTERGLEWLLVSLSLALLANVFLLGSWLYMASGNPSPYADAPIFAAAWTFLLVACIVPGYLAFRRLREGREEYGSDRRAGARRGTAAFLIAALSSVLYVVAGLVLGLVYVPGGAYTTSTSAPAVWSFLAGGAIRTLHYVAPWCIAVFAGLFLVEFLWRLSSWLPRILSLAALVTGVSAPTVVLLSLAVPSLGVTAALELGLEVTGILSLALWATVCLLVRARLRGVPSNAAANAVAL